MPVTVWGTGPTRSQPNSVGIWWWKPPKSMAVAVEVKRDPEGRFFIGNHDYDLSGRWQKSKWQPA